MRTCCGYLPLRPTPFTFELIKYFDKNGPIIANGDGEEGENSTGDCLKVQRIIILFARRVRREESIIPIGGLGDGFGGCQLEES